MIGAAREFGILGLPTARGHDASYLQVSACCAIIRADACGLTEVAAISLVVRGKLRDRLIDLSPRAFEFFAGDLLEFLGLASVSVTRQAGDGGIDAVCTMVSDGLFRVPAGVQVKRFRKPVGRPDIDKFVGSLANRFACGIFITTAAFTRASLDKAARSIPHVSTVDGDQITDVL